MLILLLREETDTSCPYKPLVSCCTSRQQLQDCSELKLAARESAMSQPLPDAKSIKPSSSSRSIYSHNSSMSMMNRTRSSRIFDMDSKYDSAIDEKSNESADFNFFEMVRLKIKKYFATSWFGRVYTNALLILSILSCVLYITQTYLNHSSELHLVSASNLRHKSVTLLKEIISYFSKIELGMAALFAFDWCLNLFIADHRMEQFLRFAYSTLKIS
jgi:hypothetical protein